MLEALVSVNTETYEGERFSGIYVSYCYKHNLITAVQHVTWLRVRSPRGWLGTIAHQITFTAQNIN